MRRKDWVLYSGAAVAFTLLAFGALPRVLRGDDSGGKAPAPVTVGGKLVEAVRALDAQHAAELQKLRVELRGQLKIVRRARGDSSMAEQAGAAGAKVSALIQKILEVETAHRAKLEEQVLTQRDALVVEVTQQLLNGKEAHPLLMGSLVPSLRGQPDELAEWNDLFKMVLRSGRLDDGGDDDDESID